MIKYWTQIGNLISLKFIYYVMPVYIAIFAYNLAYYILILVNSALDVQYDIIKTEFKKLKLIF